MTDKQESITAKLCQFARAYHSYFERDKIFDDYLAYDLMGNDTYSEMGQLIEHGFDTQRYDPNYDFKRKNIKEALNKYIAPIPLSRIAFAERETQKFAQRYGSIQYVICGAGMDTFAFRNENENITVFEIDHPDTQRYKLERVAELEWNIPKNVNYVPVDFSRDDMISKLTESGFDAGRPALFSIMGVTYYLTLPVFSETVRKISSISAMGSTIAFDFPDELTFSENAPERVRTLSDITASLGEPMQCGFSYEEIEELLTENGFEVKIHKTPQRIQEIFFKRRLDKQKAFENIHFISAEKIGYLRTCSHSL